MEQVRLLEAEWAQFNGVEASQVVACNSGTAALHLAFEALQLRRGGEVIMCDFNMVACPRAVVMAGLKPVFVDCDEKLLIDVRKVERAITGDTVAILATHIYGRRCDVDALHDIVDGTSTVVVEDLAEAHGVIPHKYTDAACWSFYRNKIVAGEEGGAVAFYSPREADLARQLRCLGFTDAHDYRHVPRGHNYRLADSLAVKVRESLRNYVHNVDCRTRRVLAYSNATPPEWRMPPRNAHWVYDVKVEYTDVDALVAELRKRGVQARCGFKPMSMQAEFRREACPGAREASQEVLYFPLDLMESVDEHRRYMELAVDLADKYVLPFPQG